MKVIVYQGNAEKFRVRLTDDEGEHVQSSEFFDDQEDAIEEARSWAEEHEVSADDIEVRETIQEVAEQNEQKQTETEGDE